MNIHVDRVRMHLDGVRVHLHGVRVHLDGVRIHLDGVKIRSEEVRIHLDGWVGGGGEGSSPPSSEGTPEWQGKKKECEEPFRRNQRHTW